MSALGFCSALQIKEVSKDISLFKIMYGKKYFLLLFIIIKLYFASVIPTSKNSYHLTLTFLARVENSIYIKFESKAKVCFLSLINYILTRY